MGVYFDVELLSLKLSNKADSSSHIRPVGPHLIETPLKLSKFKNDNMTKTGRNVELGRYEIHAFHCTKCCITSMGRGKMMVEFFSAAMVLRV